MSPADLTKPFSESCCDGGDCSDNKTSAQPCGCDPGLLKNGVIVGYLCALHQAQADLDEEEKLWKAEYTDGR